MDIAALDPDKEVLACLGAIHPPSEQPQRFADLRVAAVQRLELGACYGVEGDPQVGAGDHRAEHQSQNLDEASARLAAVLDEEDADVLIGYDWHGSYGHPDNVKVHRVVHRAAQLAARRPRLLEATMNRDAIRRMYQAAVDAGMGDQGWDPDSPADDGNPFGTPESEIHYCIDVTEQLPTKRAALACHASQTSDVGMMLAMPPEVFEAMFGREYVIEPGRAPGMRTAWYLDDDPIDDYEHDRKDDLGDALEDAG